MSVDPRDEYDGFFDYAAEIPRDQYDRPRVIPPGETVRPRNGYTRMSSVAGYLESSFAIDRWQKRRLVKGLAEREDLMAMVAALPPFTGDPVADGAINKELDVVIEAGIEWGRCHEKANWGTAIHRFVAPEGNRAAVPERMKADVDAWFRWLEEQRIMQVASEVFVVDDERQIAGTFDGLFDCPDGALRLGDYKTGRDKPLSVAVQLAGYAGGQQYSLTDERGDVIADLPNFDNRWALHLSIPAGEARVVAKEVDLEHGRLLRDIALEVREARKKVSDYSRPARDYAGLKRVEALQAIGGVSTLDEAAGVFETYRRVWDHNLKAAMTAHLKGAGIKPE